MLKVKKIVKVESIGGVEMSGTLAYYSPEEPDEPGGWNVQSGIHSRINLEDWLEKFQGRYITISINASERDESAMLAGSNADPQARIDQMAAVLRQFMAVQHVMDAAANCQRHCIYCNDHQRDGHADDCPHTLAAVLLSGE